MAKRNYPYYRLLLNGREEWHLFGIIERTNPTSGKTEFVIEKLSICEKMDQTNRRNESKILEEHYMRLHAASVGKQVCGTCISHLYLTPKDV
ncbi:hypothetical protein EHQ68_06785 [Leptospira congkakensis]|uniref:Uncharacterized protein n=1 Tax=Leptospira congkakensis TaxID=2484932 RepID=A0A4Z1A1W8_9LEPT|nr:hypothetical protein [Leptospira congkakensis]TGL87680.1 hypothetical protein EHQ69_16375 [Leptospira congkakensis]TGL89704.1 hypothetical protein EHQ68_06785 [Leptospira congkakensis]TGL95830.1 hypothetical protein EHQ70_12045 [Leptospira congkakensis]